jgi:polysaccharide export outer membrane protein
VTEREFIWEVYKRIRRPLESDRETTPHLTPQAFRILRIGGPRFADARDVNPAVPDSRRRRGRLDVPSRRIVECLLLALPALTVGCRGADLVRYIDKPLPGENREATMTEYVVNPPDVLFVEIEPSIAGKALQPGDELLIDIKPSVKDPHVVEAVIVKDDGTIQLRSAAEELKLVVAPIKVAGLKAALVQEKIGGLIKDEYPSALVAVIAPGVKAIAGQFLVRPDGNVKISTYGCVPVAGRPLSIVEAMVQQQVVASSGLVDAKVSVDVLAYNSMAYYVVADGGGFGDQVIKLPFTGRERVLDAVAEIGGLPSSGSKYNIWIARPNPGCAEESQILPVDWEAVTRRGSIVTNYQLLPGDRLFIKTDHLIASDIVLSKLLSPFERVLNFVNLGAITQQSVSGRLNTGIAVGVGQ